jgi:hypothetical protein
VTDRERVMWAGALLLIAACGGLAEDGRRLGLDAAACEAGQTCADERRARDDPSPEARARGARTSGGAIPSTPASGSGTEIGTDERPSESSPRVGDPCEIGSGVGPERIAVGNVVLEMNGSCGAGVLCLMRAPHEAGTCDAELGSVGACQAPAKGDVVPVPPSLAPAPPPVDGVCSCRCDGLDRAEAYCACPADMTCRDLIVSSGVNGAARAYLGSYCVY